ncbi:L-aspartate oxidase [Lederbergia lenta]|uniref:L-aspartate oxidase n=1 Tax=Lederbergia lenta TaxID=1467 RepID=A0A2X4W2W9_LEDLE|nr:L-aspartate oxidase [Lederbergia lenta]MEC2324712.1 L-aspartate oxidase [Lederbergia lenta]SQI58496.1 L-aspartate oxidase [Lederbergia lenta]
MKDFSVKLFDVIIVGGGIAGKMLAHRLPASMSIACITKEKHVSNSIIAQGGIAAAIAPDDHPVSHFEDTIAAANAHADIDRVNLLVTEGSKSVQALIEEGLLFDRDPFGNWSFGQEAAHSKRRILHAGGDATGKGIMDFLEAKTDDKLSLLTNLVVVELIMIDGKCAGVIVLDSVRKKSRIYGKHIVLATGGIGQLYENTSNAVIASGDGISLAYHAGALLADLEFVQFHPTILQLSGKSEGLISEAVRGEGALLIDEDGRRIMEGVHPSLELAPRDIVARAIEENYQKQKKVFLNAQSITGFSDKFPTIYRNCLHHSIDPLTENIPVRPGAHFHMGGIRTNEWSETSIPYLYAIGETACTGVHGANRLASNSLLESLVFAERAAQMIQSKINSSYHIVNDEPFQERTLSSLPSIEEMKKMMTTFAGIIRDQAGLERLLDRLRPSFEQLSATNFSDLAFPMLKIAHFLTSSYLIAQSALLRTESRGAHYRSDVENPDDKWSGKVIIISKDGCYQTNRRTNNYQEKEVSVK